MLFHAITKEEKQQLLPLFSFSQYRVNLTLGSDFFFFHKCLSVDPLVGFFIVPLSNWHPFNLLLFFLGFVFSLFSQLKNFTHPFSWQSDSALWCSAASWFFQVLQGRVSQIDISCGSVPSQLGDSPEVQCCVARQTVKKRHKSLWPGELTCSPDKSKLMEKT